MSLRFIVGRAGSGKTSLCYSEIIERLGDGGDNSLILLVPEQATFQNEMGLAERVPSGGLMRAQVTSFRRLAWITLNEAGGASRLMIDELGRKMILRGIIERKKGEFTVFERAAGQTGFTDVIADLISELKLYRVSPGDLSKVLEAPDMGSQSRLCGKLRDIGLLFSGLEEHLEGKYVDPDDYMNILADQVHLSPTVRGAEVWVDGFNGFTPQEFMVLKEIMKVARRLNVTVCAGGDVLDSMPGEGHVFYQAGEIVNKLTGMAGESGVSCDVPVRLERSLRFNGAPALEHIEKNYFNITAPPLGEARGVRVVAAAGPRAEVEAAAREILRLCRDCGCRWREISVLTRDIGRYHVLIETVFSDYGIPFFIDHKRPVAHHPLVELIRSALEVAGEGWSYEPVFRYLKTGLAPVAGEDADILENYVLAHGIRGSAWTDGRDWCYIRGGVGERDGRQEDAELLRRINRIKREGLGALTDFCGRMKPERSVRGMTEALFQLLVDLGVPSTLAEWSEGAAAAGDLITSREHDRIWGQVVHLLDQVVVALGDEEMPPDRYGKILESGLAGLRLGLIPPGLDQVTVGSMDRSRSAEIKAALLLGVNDGIFPARPPAGGVLTDNDRVMLARNGVSLAPGSRRKVFDEQLLVYIALTRASEQLWISYSMADGEGRSMLPSRIVKRVRYLLPGVREQMVTADPPDPRGDDLEFVAGGGRTLGYLSSRLRDYLSGKVIHPVWWDVYNWYAAGGGPDGGLDMVRKGLFFSNVERNVPPDLVRGLYGERMRAGISGIERFNSCPFAYFLTYGLKLRERDHYKLTPPDLGQFLHLALKMLAERIKMEGRDWADLGREELTALADETVESIAPGLQNEIFLSTARYRYMLTRLKKRLARAALIMSEHYRRGKFRPVGLEVRFGRGGELPPIVLELPGGATLEINGRIDRIDACRCGSETHIMVVDYKSGYIKMDISEMYYGLNIQLPAYLDVALSGSALLTGAGGRPAGMFYFTVDDPLISADGPVDSEEVEKMIMRRMRMSGMALADAGVVKMIDSEISGQSDVIQVAMKAGGGFYKNSPVLTAEQFGLLRTFLRGLYKKTGERIFSGEVAIGPARFKGRTACRYCGYRAVCGFDEAVPGNSCRPLPDLDEVRLWESISGIPEVGEDE
ncbi:MAG: helicase-exonuclease AddAB subunit AddB [Bacillota bacterium]